MSPRSYPALIEELCRLYGIIPTGDLAHGAQIAFAGIALTLLPGEEADSLLLFCDFGEPPWRWRAEVLQRILESNLFMFAADSPHLSIDHESGRVMLLDRMLVSRLSASALFGKLERYAQHAQRWHSSFERIDMDTDTEAALDERLAGLTLPTAANHYRSGSGKH
jgi:hypothetical protein